MDTRAVGGELRCGFCVVNKKATVDGKLAAIKQFVVALTINYICALSSINI